MYTSKDLLDMYQFATNDTSSTNQTRGQILINDTYKKILNSADLTLNEDEWYTDTIADQESYPLPFNYSRLIAVEVIIGTTHYTPTEVISTQKWQEITATESTADGPTDYYIFDNSIFFYPTPATAGNDIYIKYKKTPKEFGAFTEYSTGTVSISSNLATVTGSGTTFTSGMAGRSIKFTDDGIWYPIETFVSTTSLTLDSLYEGSTISGGTYRIGEVPIIADGFQSILWQEPASIYLAVKGPRDLASYFKDEANKTFLQLKSRYQNKTVNQVFNNRETERKNPNDYPENLG